MITSAHLHLYDRTLFFVFCFKKNDDNNKNNDLQCYIKLS